MSSTGDIKNNLSKLLRELKRMNIKREPNLRGMILGIPSAFLPILHAALMSYSLPLAQHLASLGIELYGRSDLRFVEGLYKVMRDVFQYRSKITRDQFLTIGFAECKVILTVDILKQCQKKHTELSGPSIKTSTRKNCFQLKSKTTPSSSTTSFATVHTIAGTAGVGSVWQERVTTDGSPKPHLPLSPPASPLQSPHTSGDPTIIPEPVSVLELTPDSTPLKQSFSSSSSSWQRHDKEVTVMLDSSGDSDVEIVTIKSADNLEVGEGAWFDGCVQDKVKARTVNTTQQEQLVLATIDAVSSKVQDMMTSLDRLTNRMTLVETGLKILQDKGVVSIRGPSRDCGTQTDTVVSKEVSVGVSPPKVTTPTTVHRSPATPTHLTTPSELDFSTPVSINSSLTPRTPDEAKQILRKIRTRTQQTRELLNRVNTASATDPLIYPVH